MARRHAKPTSGCAAPRDRRTALGVAGLLLVVAAPLIVGLGALAGETWVPTLDLAMTELRVRDVASGDPPLIGLPGRIGTLQEQGSHAGPVSFWGLWPLYQLFGASAWALQVAAVALHVLAVGTALWIAHRRGGIGLALGVGLVLAVLVRTYTLGTLAEPWNLFLPLLWWVVLLLAVWSVLCRDLALLPVAAFAGSFCAQTHVSYLGLVGGLGLVAVGAAALTVRARWSDRDTRGAALRWCAIAAAVGGVLWVPPVIDEVAHSPGNLSILRDYFGDPPEAPIGLVDGVELVLVRLDPWALITDEQTAPRALADASQTTGGSIVPGTVLLAAWAVAVVAARRLRHQVLLRLHLVLGVSLVVGAVSASRIFVFVWWYLVLWVWGITALVVLATGWTLAAWAARRLDAPRRRRWAGAGRLVLGGATLVSSALLVPAAVDVEVPAARLSATVDRLAPATAEALAERTPPDGGARYLVTWSDALSIGSQGLGLLNELERRGFDVGVTESYRVPATPERVLAEDDAAAVVHLATGPSIEAWRAEPGYEEVASVDPRTAGERAEYERLRARAIVALRRAGRDELVPLVDDNLFAAAIDTRVPRPVRELASRMLDLGVRSAVFVGPPTAGRGAVGAVDASPPR